MAAQCAVRTATVTIPRSEVAGGRTRNALPNGRLHDARTPSRCRGLACDGISRVAEDPPFALIKTIPLPGTPGKLDHFALDAAGGRLFVSNQGNSSLDVIDVATGKGLTQVPGQKLIHGIAYVPGLDWVFVGNGDPGECAAIDGKTYEVLKRLPVKAANNVQYESRSGRVFVGGAALTPIDPKELTVGEPIKLPAAAKVCKVAGEPTGRWAISLLGGPMRSRRRSRMSSERRLPWFTSSISVPRMKSLKLEPMAKHSLALLEKSGTGPLSVNSVKRKARRPGTVSASLRSLCSTARESAPIRRGRASARSPENRALIRGRISMRCSFNEGAAWGAIDHLRFGQARVRLRFAFANNCCNSVDDTWRERARQGRCEMRPGCPPPAGRSARRPLPRTPPGGQSHIEDLGDPLGVTKKLWGLMSRWTMPISRACSSPRAAWRT